VPKLASTLRKLGTPYLFIQINPEYISLFDHHYPSTKFFRLHCISYFSEKNLDLLAGFSVYFTWKRKKFNHEFHKQEEKSIGL
jgi:hypothetical protein